MDEVFFFFFFFFFFFAHTSFPPHHLKRETKKKKKPPKSFLWDPCCVSVGRGRGRFFFLKHIHLPSQLIWYVKHEKKKGLPYQPPLTPHREIHHKSKANESIAIKPFYITTSFHNWWLAAFNRTRSSSVSVVRQEVVSGGAGVLWGF